MLAEILTFGDELCRGEIIDTNSSWLAAELWDLDITCTWMTSCRDVAEDMRQALRQAVTRADVVVCSGGLGPTEDDLTVDVVAELAGTGPETHRPSLERMEARYAAAAYRPTPNTLRQVRAPAGARVHDNPAGAAPGFEVSLGGVPVLCVPGVPREMKAIFDSALRARLVELRDRGAGPGAAREHIARRIYRVFGLGESQIASQLEGLLDGPAGAAGATLHYQVSFPETLVKVVVRDRDAAAAAARLAELDRAVRARLGDWCYGQDADSLAAALGRALLARGLTLATAESCTGGLAGGLITAVPGSSRYYAGGAVCYANQEKVRQLGVDPATIERHGAVSEECAREMAAGIRARCGADVAVSVTGVAGPDGGSPDKPVGTVWLAVAGPGDSIATKHFVWPGARDQIRGLAAHWALALVLRAIAPRAGAGSATRPETT
jgi:nicotinamide-nucleotide amidase